MFLVYLRGGNKAIATPSTTHFCYFFDLFLSSLLAPLLSPLITAAGKYPRCASEWGNLGRRSRPHPALTIGSLLHLPSHNRGPVHAHPTAVYTRRALYSMDDNPWVFDLIFITSISIKESDIPSFLATVLLEFEMVSAEARKSCQTGCRAFFSGMWMH